MDCLSIPSNVREKIGEHSKDEEQQRHECFHYYLKSSPFALWGWEDLGGDLQFYGQEAALTAAKAYIQRAPGTCGCGMCMYWTVEDACDCEYITQQIHACSNVYIYICCVYSSVLILLITLMLTCSDHICAHVHLHTHIHLHIHAHRAITDTRYSIQCP